MFFVTLFCCWTVSASHAEEEEEQSDSFTILWISDTQDISYHGYGKAFDRMGKWILEQKDAMNIRYIVQTGDAVDNGASLQQWKRFDVMYDQFRGKIPYISAAGNHEVKKNGYFDYWMRRDIRAIPRGNTFMRGEASYSTFDYEGNPFILVSIGYGVGQDAVKWTNDILKTHKDHTAILLVHDYLQTDGRFGVNGKALFDQIVQKSPNVRVVLCGHVLGVSSRIDALDDNHDGKPDRTVAQLMYDYQHFAEDCGQLRTLTFQIKDRSIHVTTYSPVTERYYRDYMFGDHYSFTLTNAF